jgi:hypothetical protein
MMDAESSNGDDALSFGGVALKRIHTKQAPISVQHRSDSLDSEGQFTECLSNKLFD